VSLCAMMRNLKEAFVALDPDYRYSYLDQMDGLVSSGRDASPASEFLLQDRPTGLAFPDVVRGPSTSSYSMLCE
jgi:hypothetical protein